MKPTHKLIHGDCLEELPNLAAGSVDCVIADIPYYGVVSDEWDNQWATVEEYQAWVNSWAVELKRIVKKNGSIYIFGDAKMAAYVQVVLDRHFLMLNNITWYKTNNLPIKNVHSLRSYAPMTERIMFYTPQGDRTGLETVKLDIENFQPLRAYFKAYQEAIGLSLKAINTKMGHRRAEHAFYWRSTQWDLPTRETYQQLGEVFPVDFLRREYDFLRREYEDLRREYEDLRREYEDLRRVWNTDGNTLDVIIGGIVSGTDNTPHPTTKPLWLLRLFINASTNKGDTILDFTMGSGSTGVAAVSMGRNFIGMDNGHCEKEGLYHGWRWVDVAAERIANANNEFTPTAKEKQSGQLNIFEMMPAEIKLRGLTADEYDETFGGDAMKR